MVAVTSAIVGVLAAGLIGARASTEPAELACEFVGVSADESGRSYPTAIAAAAGLAGGVLGEDPSTVENTGRVVEVADPGAFSGTTGGGRVFAIRDDGRTVGLLHVHRDVGGWTIGRIELC